MTSISEKDALELLEKRFGRYRPDWKQSISDHSIIVHDLALFLARKIMEKGHKADLKLLGTACILHDIGYATTKESIKHGVESARVLRDEGLEREARAAECHIGIGITPEDAEKLGLGYNDYMPKTIEEKILCYADNLDFFDRKTKKHTIKDSKAVEERFGKELGDKYRRRTEEFNRIIEDMAGGKGMDEFRNYVTEYNVRLAAGHKLKLQDMVSETL